MTFRSTLSRLVHITAVIIRHIVGHALCLMAERMRWLARVVPVRLAGPERLRVMIEDLGGTFIKFGQMLALQPDIIPLEYCNALFDLLDRVAPFEYAEVERTFVDEFGKKPTEIFDSFETKPLATASIGQVHAAYLDGQKVAVKVRRPSAETDFTGDARLMKAAMRLIKYLRLKFLYWLIEPMSEFIEWTGEELDYRYEARYMERLRRNAVNNPCEHVPKVFWSYVTRRTLVVEFLDGVTVLDYLRAIEAGDDLMLHRLKTIGFDPDKFAENIINNFVSDAFQHGMFHADLHPANLMILPDNVVGYIDFGITAVLSRYSRQNLISLTYALVRADPDGMCAPFFNVSVLDNSSEVEMFRAGMKRFEEKWYADEGRQRRLKVSTTIVMLDMIRLSRQTNIWPERDVVKYIRSSIAADGLITRFAPGFNLGQQLSKVCDYQLKRQSRKALLTYDRLLGWASSNRQLVQDGAIRMASLLHSIASGRLPAEVEVNGAVAGGGGSLQRRALQLAMIIFVATLMITVGREPMQLGVNLFTAELTLVASAALMFLRAIRRLT